MKNLFRDYWPQYLSGISALGLVVGSIGFSVRLPPPPVPALYERWEFWTVLVSALTSIIGLVFTGRYSARISKLDEEINKLKAHLIPLQKLEEEVQQKYDDLCALHLSALMNRMGLSPNDRVSVYKHNGASFFYRVGRYSAHPGHARPGRSIYPDGEGCMGRALSHGTAVDETLPANTESYTSRLKTTWGMTEEAITGLTMRSRSIAAFALQRPVGGKRFAIIVFESMSPGSITEDRRKRFTSEEKAGIVQWLETMERFEPKPADAKREGF